MIRLLGRNPVDGPTDRRVAEVFAASNAIRPKGKPFDDLLSDMSELALEDHVKAVVAMWPDLSQRGEKAKARQSLIDLVEGEIERLWEIVAEHDEDGADEPARTRRRKGFVHTKEADAMRRYFLRAKGSVERGGKVLRQEIRARKADRDAQGVPPVPGKEVSPYDGRPASWWRESVGEGRRAEDGGRRTEDGNQGGGRGAEDGGAGGRTEGGGRRTEGRDAGRRAEDGGRRTEDGNQGGGRGAEDGGAGGG